jgi:hypothetical protein
MATNNNGNLLDDSGEVAIDFVWGNFPIQPNDARPNTTAERLDPALDNHIIALSGWNGFPLYNPNTAGEDVVGATDYVLVPSVLGLTTVLAVDAMKDASLTTTAAAATTNTTSTITGVARTGTAATITSSGAGAKYPVGTKVTVASLVSPDTDLNGTWTVTAGGTNTVSFTTTTSGTLLTTGLTVSGLSGAAGKIKTQSLAAGQNNVVPGAAVTVTPWAAAS